MCVFCEIIKGNIPSRKVYEDENYIAILDIAQVTKGHTLVIPKKHTKNYADLSSDEFAELMKITHKVSEKVVKKMNALGDHLLINTNEVSGQTVDHVHCHIIPRYSNEDAITLKFNPTSFDLDEILKQINA